MTDNIDDVVAAAESIGPNEVVLIELSHGSILADLDDVPKAVPFSIYVLLPTLIVAALSCSLSKISHDACRPLIACCSQRLAFHRHPRLCKWDRIAKATRSVRKQRHLMVLARIW